MKYKNITFILIIFLFLINPVDADSKVAPYAEIPTQHSANWPYYDTYPDAEFIQAAHNDRIRQNGEISKIKFNVADASKLIEFYFTIWRENESGGYDRIAITENLKEDISDGINEIELSEPISGVQEGDYYGYRIETSGDALYIDTSEPRLTYYVHGITSSTKNFDWKSQDWMRYIFVIEPYMDNPYMIFIGDSIICGDPVHLSFLHYEDYTNIPSTIEYQWSKKVDDRIYQNMGHGGDGTIKIQERFNPDAIDLNPDFVLIEGGVNDIRNVPDDTVVENWRLMIQEAHEHDITPLIMLILPWTDSSNLESERIDDINDQLIEMAEEYGTSIVVDARSYVGVERSSGPEGNLWDINPDYDSDGTHFNSAGHERIAQAIKESFKYVYGKPGLNNLIQSDGTIIYSEGLDSATNTSWRMASTSGTANVNYNEPSTDEIANFTINSGSIKWFSIDDLSQDQVYNLRHSDGTLIESSTSQNGIVSFTIAELPEGTYYVDTPLVITDVNHDTPTTNSVNITWDTNKNSDSQVRYSTTSGNYPDSTSDQEMVTSHSIELSGLSPGITYYFIVVSEDRSDDQVQSDEYNFTTADADDTTSPDISNVVSTTPTTDSVTISWDTDEDSDSLIKYGTEQDSYTDEVPDPALVSSHSIDLSGLNSDTTYYYVVNSTDESSNSAQSNEYSFTTADADDTTPPDISNVVSTTPTTDSVTISWDTDEDSDSLIKYGTEQDSYTDEVPDPALVSSHSIELSGLNSDTTYYYVVNSTDESSNSAQSNEYSFTTADAADTTPPDISNVVSTTPTTDSVTISWDTDEDSDSLIKYGTEQDSYTNEVPDPALVISHSIDLSGLNSDTTYYYVVNSTDESSNSAQSNEYSFTTADADDTTPPDISNVVSTTPTTDSVTISWNTDEDSDSLIKYGTEQDSYTYEVPDPALVSLHSIDLSGLNSDTTYYYVVNSTDESSNSAQSNEYSFTTADAADTTPPDISNVVNTTPTTDSATISWNTDEDSDSLIKYGTEQDSYTYEVPDPALVSSHSIDLSGLNSDTTYYYVVNSTDESSNSAQSNEYSFTTADADDTTPPDISNVVSTTPTTDSVTISWDTDEDSDSLIKYGTEQDSYTDDVSDPVLVSSHSINLSGLNYNTTYYYIVNSTDASGNSAQSDEYSFTTVDAADTTPPVITIIANTTPTTDSVTISWDTDEDSDSLIKYGTEQDSYTDDVSDPVLVSSHSINLSGLNYNTTYYYVVNSTDASGNSAQSDEYSFTTADAADTTPPVITIIANTTPTTDSVTISWDTDEDSDSLIKYGTEQDSYTDDVSDPVLVSSHSINLSGLNYNTTYYYVVNSTDASTNSAQSDEYSFTTADVADTTPPVISNVANTTPTTDSVTISWDTDEDSDSLIKYGTESGGYTFEVPDTALVSSHSIMLSGLNYNTTYFYVVNSTDASGNSEQSDEYSFTTADIPDTTPPVISNVSNTTLTTDSVTISWDTDEASDSLIKYGTESGSYTFEVPDTALVSSHSIDLNGLNSDTTYYYVVNSTDASGNSEQNDEYSFTTADIPDTTSPMISQPEDKTVEQESACEITWMINETNPAQYLILRDGTEAKSPADYQSGEDIITFQANTSTLGIWSYTIIANDTSGNSASDQVDITIVDETLPVISHPEDQVIEQGTPGNITWSITEVEHDTYWVLRNGIQIVEPTHYQSGTDFTVLIEDTLVSGVWNYTIFANDTSGNTASDQVDITVQDTLPPVITGPADHLIEQNATGYITWNIYDANPDAYQVLRNNIQVFTGYQSDEDIIILINTTTLGDWNYSIIANDTLGHTTEEHVIITVRETIPPVIEHPSVPSIERCEIGNITWTITDRTPNKYWVLRNGIEVVSPIDFQSGAAIIIPINTSKEGIWNYTIVANDTSGNTTSSDQVDIIVDEKIPLLISITFPSDDYYTTSMTITVTGTVDGNCSYPAVSVNGNEAQLELVGYAGIFSASVPLKVGTNFITATATNAQNEHKESNTIEVTRKKEVSTIRRSGGGDSGGSSGEDFGNILISEVQREYISKDKEICYHFNNTDNIVMDINFTGLISAGIIPAKVEILKSTSSLVNYPPVDIVCKDLNIWVGNYGWANSKTIVNATIKFKLDRSWITQNDIDISTIRMNRFDNGKWNQLETTLIDQDVNNLYFMSKTSGFSSFVVTGKHGYIGKQGGEGILSATETSISISNETSIEDKTDTPGFSLITCMVVLLITVFRIRKE